METDPLNVVAIRRKDQKCILHASFSSRASLFQSMCIVYCVS